MGKTAIELGVVIPVYNEEANLRNLFTEWQCALSGLGVSYRLWFVNDGSRDGSAAMLDSIAAADAEHVQVIHQANAGHGAACRRGYETALGEGALWILQVDSDGQCDAGYLAAFWAARHEADCIFGERRQRDDGWTRSLISKVCAAVVGRLCKVRMADLNVPYRLMRSTALAQALKSIPPDFHLQNIALSIMLRRARWRWKFIPIHFRARAGGTNSIHLGSIVRLGWQLLDDVRRLPA